jgi:hypothetical protein
MKRIWVKKYSGFQGARTTEFEYYERMTSSARVETVQVLREMCFKLKGGRQNDCSKGLRRTVKVIQQTQG